MSLQSEPGSLQQWPSQHARAWASAALDNRAAPFAGRASHHQQMSVTAFVAEGVSLGQRGVEGVAIQRSTDRFAVAEPLGWHADVCHLQLAPAAWSVSEEQARLGGDKADHQIDLSHGTERRAGLSV